MIFCLKNIRISLKTPQIPRSTIKDMTLSVLSGTVAMAMSLAH